MTLNLRTRFLLLFGAIFILGGAAGYSFFVWYSDDVITSFGHRLAERNALYEKSKVLSMVTREVTLSQKLASSPLLKQWIADEKNAKLSRNAIAELEDYRRFFRNHSYFVVMGKSGNYYYSDNSSSDPSAPRYTVSESVQKDGWFYAMMKGQRDVQLNVDTDRHLGITKVWINTVVRDEQLRAIAVAGSALDLSDFVRTVISGQEPGTTMSLIDERGAIQAHQDISMIDFASVRKAVTGESQHTLFSLLDRPDDVSALQAAMQQLKGRESEAMTLELQVQGHRQLTGITWVPEIQWFIVTMVHPAAVTSKSLIPFAAMSLAIALGLVLLIAAVIIERTMMRRLARLDGAANTLSEGQYKITLDDDTGDEIGRLTRTFSAMAGRIAAHTEDLEKQISERTSTLERMAYTDFLTDTLNRRGMMARLNVETKRIARQNQLFGLMIVDIDFFKRINDSFGHAVGDQALVAVARILSSNIRGYDACARWGGEEFLVGLFGINKREELQAITKKMLEAVRGTLLDCEDTKISLTYSIGAVLADPTMDIDYILKQADEALYQAKKNGRDQAVVVEALTL